MMKKVWMSLIDKDEKKAQEMVAKISGYGLGVEGHF